MGIGRLRTAAWVVLAAVLGCQSRGAVPPETLDLIAAVEDSPDPDTRRRAVEKMMATRTHPAHATVPVLIKALEDPNLYVKSSALESLRLVTGHGVLGADPAAWRGWWEENADRFDPDRERDEDTVAQAHARYQNDLGLATLRKGDYFGAEQHFLHAIAKHPDNALYHNNLGLARYKRRDFEGALAKFQEAIQHDRNLAEAHLNLGNCYQQMGPDYWSAAAASYDRAIALDVNKRGSEIYHQYAILHLKRATELGKVTGRLLEDPDSSPYREYGEALAKADRALEIMKRLRERPGWLTRTMGLRVQAYFGQERYFLSVKEVLAIEELGYDVRPPGIREKVLDMLRRDDPEGYRTLKEKHPDLDARPDGAGHTPAYEGYKAPFEY